MKMSRLVFMILALLLLVSCGSDDSGAGGQDINLTGADGQSDVVSFAALKEMEVTEGYGGWLTSVGTIIPPVKYKGVTIATLLESVGSLPEGKAVEITATDDYSMNLSYDQIQNNGLPVFNSLTAEEFTYTETLSVIVAYEKDGLPISEEDGGPYRLAVVSEKSDQITDGHWWIKQVRDLEIIDASKDYSLLLDGPHDETIDRNTFESGTGAGCHGFVYTDDKADKWSGIPLWLLVGYMDDENVHESKSFNRDLVKAGYTVKVHSEDGTILELDAERVAENNNIILANQQNEIALSDDLFPLRLVGTDLEESEMLGKIVKISMELK